MRRVSAERGEDGAFGDARGGGWREVDGELRRGEVRISLVHKRACGVADWVAFRLMFQQQKTRLYDMHVPD